MGAEALLEISDGEGLKFIFIENRLKFIISLFAVHYIFFFRPEILKKSG